jgi:multidrug efflux pump subunit AcrB
MKLLELLSYYVLNGGFIPVSMSGPVGFFRQFAITMATAIIPGIVALTLTPALCAMMLKIRETLKRKLYK